MLLRCDSNLDLQSNLPRLAASLMDLTSFFLWKMLDIVLEYCFIIGKTLGLLGLHVTVKGIITSYLVVFGCLKNSRGISLSLNMLASVSSLWYFCSSNVFICVIVFIFSFSTMVPILLVRENGIFLKQCRGWFDVNGTYRFESVGLL